MLLLNANCRNTHRSVFPTKDRVDPTGLVLHYPTLRQHLLNIRSMSEFDTSRYLVDKKTLVSPTADTGERFSDLLVLKTASWVVESRKVYHLEEDLHLVLAAASFGNLTCGEIPWPVKTFGISLARAMTILPTDDLEKAKQCDFILASTPAKFDALGGEEPPDRFSFAGHYSTFLVLNQTLKHWRPLSRKALRGLQEATVREHGPLPATWDRFKKEESASTEALAGPLFASWAPELGGASPDWKIEDVLSLLEQNDEQKDSARWWRLIIALCFHIQTLGRNGAPSPRVEITPRKSHTPDLTAITQCSEICIISSDYELTPAVRERLRKYCATGRGGWELPFHFRIAHMRRPWGTASIPGQEKTVYIPITMVNRDRLPEGAQARGSTVRLGS